MYFKRRLSQKKLARVKLILKKRERERLELLSWEQLVRLAQSTKSFIRKLKTILALPEEISAELAILERRLRDSKQLNDDQIRRRMKQERAIARLSLIWVRVENCFLWLTRSLH